MKNNLQGYEEGPEANIHLDSQRVTHKKVPDSKASDQKDIYGFLL